MRFRKKPVVVEAVQFTGGNTKECCQFIGVGHILGCSPGESIEIKTREGSMRADIGDWIIREPFPSGDRRFYPCKPDIFAATYEATDPHDVDHLYTDEPS